MDRTTRKFVLSLANATLAMSICLVIAFAAFLSFRFPIAETLVWMLALGSLAFGGTFVGSWIGHSMGGQREGDARPVAASF